MFGRTQPLAISGPPLVVHLEGDGFADVVVGLQTGRLQTFVADSEGNLMTESSVMHGLGPLVALAAGAGDSPSSPSLALWDSGARAQLIVNDFGTLSARGPMIGSGITYADGTMADIDDDGRADLAAVHTSSTTSSLVFTIVGTGGSLFGPNSRALSGVAHALSYGPVEESRTTFVVIGSANLWIARYQSDEVQVESHGPVLMDARDVAVANIDGVDPAEIIITEGAAARVRVLRVEEGGLVEVQSVPIPSEPSDVVAVDVDGDGVDEVLVRTGSQLHLLSTCAPP